jgi:hypothetical protein
VQEAVQVAPSVGGAPGEPQEGEGVLCKDECERRGSGGAERGLHGGRGRGAVSEVGGAAGAAAE